MRLKRLSIDRLPGIDEPFEIKPAGAGIHVVFGPNAIGKSSICRAVEALYWGDRGPSERTYVTGEFQLDRESWWAERDGSRVRWRCDGEDRMPPGLPASQHHRSFFLRLRDLVDPSRDGTEDVASEIRRQMSGGFDLARIVRDRFPEVTRHSARPRRNEFGKAMRAVQEAEGRQAGLERRAARLRALKAELEGSLRAACRLPFVVRAVGLAARIEQHVEVVRRVEAMPPALARLSGEELDQVGRLQGQIDELGERELRLEGKGETHRTARRDTRLPGEIDGADLEVWRKRADELERTELELRTARMERGERQRQVEAAHGALGGGDLERAALTLQEHTRLFEFLREAEEHRANRRAFEWRLRLLREVDEGERRQEGESRIEELRSGVETLRRWLRSPAPEAPRAALLARRGWVLLALSMVLAGGGLALFGDPRFGLLLAAGAGLLVPVLLMRGAPRDARTRADAEVTFGRLEVAPPDAWNARSVEARLRTLEGDVAATEARREMAKFRDADRQSLRSELSGLADREPSLDDRRRRILEELGLDAMQPDAELVDTVRALDQLRAAWIQYERASGGVEALEATRAGLLAELADTLQGHGEPAPDDASTAKAYLDRLSSRSEQLARAISGERRVIAQREEVATDREAAGTSVRAIYSKASLDDGDLPGLRELASRLEAFGTLRSEARDLESRNALDREALAAAGESELAAFEKARLDRLAEGLSVEAGGADARRREIADIEAEVKEARRSSSLQDLIARQEETRAELQERRDAAIFARAGRFLIDAVEREYEQTQMPRVFERARSHFSAFTHHGYELRIGRDSEPPRLFAIDLQRNDRRELDELSDGTRAHLLLAARMAFAEEVERGLTLPLFLDEALDQSDPARFDAIARSLGRIAKDQGRQIFYLTSDPLDRERIRRALVQEDCVIAAEIDLGTSRGVGVGAVKEPSDLRIPPRASVPMPGGVTAEEYGSLIGVPDFEPGRGYARQHFFYLLSDDLELLHALLENRIERAGQWRTVSGSRLAARLASCSETSGQIGSRVRLLEVFSEAWKQGRGRAVDRDTLVESGALSQRYVDDTVEIAGELGGDPVRLLAALRRKGDPRLKRFRKTNADALEEHLRDAGYLDDRPVLAEGDLTRRALSSPPANELPHGIAVRCLERWWAWAARTSGSGP